jgi:hypothetical protein
LWQQRLWVIEAVMIGNEMIGRCVRAVALATYPVIDPTAVEDAPRDLL